MATLLKTRGGYHRRRADVPVQIDGALVFVRADDLDAGDRAVAQEPKER